MALSHHSALSTFNFSIRSGVLRTLLCVVVLLLLQGLYRTDLSAQAPFSSIELNGSGIGSIRRIAWHPNGSLIALAIDDRVAIYDSSLQLVGNLTGHTDLVRGMAWSPSGDLLASASEDNTAKIWDARVAEPTFGDVLLTLVEDDDVFNVSWDNTGTFLVLQVFDHYVRYSDSSDVYTTLKIRDASTGSLLQTLPMQTNSIVPQWDSAGRVVTSSLDERYRIKLWDPALGAFAESRLSLGSRFTSIAFNSTKTLLAAGTANAVVVLDANTLERRFDLYIVSANNSVAWHPSDLYIATSNDDGRLDIWKATNTSYVEFSAHAGRISSIQWNSDGTKLATLSYGDENILKIWDTSGLPTVATEPTATYFPTITPEPTPVTPTATPLPDAST